MRVEEAVRVGEHTDCAGKERKPRWFRSWYVHTTGVDVSATDNWSEVTTNDGAPGCTIPRTAPPTLPKVSVDQETGTDAASAPPTLALPSTKLGTWAGKYSHCIATGKTKVDPVNVLIAVSEATTPPNAEIPTNAPKSFKVDS